MNNEYEHLTDTELDELISNTERKIVMLHNKQMSIKILKHS